MHVKLANCLCVFCLVSFENNDYCLPHYASPCNPFISHYCFLVTCKLRPPIPVGVSVRSIAVPDQTTPSPYSNAKCNNENALPAAFLCATLCIHHHHHHRRRRIACSSGWNVLLLHLLLCACPPHLSMSQPPKSNSDAWFFPLECFHF